MASVPEPAAEPSAWRVADGSKDPNNPSPGHLYFVRRPGAPSPIPLHQEKVHQELEDASFVIRVALQESDPKRFNEFHNRLLSTAQAAFDPAGFNESAVNDLTNFKREVCKLQALP